MSITIVNVKVVTHYDVFIGRGSKWGNPFIIGKDGDRLDVINEYERYLLKANYLMDSLHELKDKSLGCFCAPEICHGDVLKYYAEHLSTG